MNLGEKAKVILESLEKYVQVDYNFEKLYIKGIIEGLKEIEKEEAEEKAIEILRFK